MKKTHIGIEEKIAFIKHKLQHSQKRLWQLSSVFGLLILLNACSSSSTDSQPELEGQREETTNQTNGLFLSLSGDPNGLYLLDTSTEAVTRVGDGKTSMENAPGLASKGASEPLVGASDFALYEIKRDGSGAALIGNPSGQALTEGLAYNPDEGILYASSNGFLHIRSPETGETLETVLNPPNQPDIEGMAYDPESKTLYGLARGAEQQPQFRRSLYLIDTSLPKNEWEWVELGDTEGLWGDAGLAFVPEIKMLFAVGRLGDPDGFYSISPETGVARRIGSTGLGATSGGLAWVPEK